MIELLPWDTAFFGVRIGRARPPLDPATARAIAAQARAAGFACAYLLADAADVTTVRAAEDAGFRMADVRLTFERDLAAGPAARPNDVTPMRDAVEGDREALRADAAAAFSKSRFWGDPHFSRERCAALYETWIERDLREHRVRVAEAGGAPAGYVTLAERGDEAQIGLLGVLPSSRGGGLGLALVDDAAAIAKAGGARRLLVVTQGANTAAQRLYQRSGFVTRSVELWLHLWTTA
jgi:ribosomal protein S18 acetylase RimI-like enzyme